MHTITEATKYMDKMALQFRGKQACKFMPSDSIRYVSVNHATERNRIMHKAS